MSTREQIQAPGTEPQAVGEPSGGVRPLGETFRVPPDRNARGPFGQVVPNVRDDRPVWPIFPTSLQTNYLTLRTDASGANTEARLTIYRPTVLQVQPLPGSFAGAAAIQLYALPEIGTPYGAGVYRGVPAKGGRLYIPSAGVWILQAKAQDTAGAFVATDIPIVQHDATSPVYAEILQAQGIQNALNGGDALLAVGNTQVLTLNQVLALEGLDIVNPNAAVVRLEWGTAASATQGITLNPLGTFGDRIRWRYPMIPMQELNAWNAAGGALTLTLYNRAV